MRKSQGGVRICSVSARRISAVLLLCVVTTNSADKPDAKAAKHNATPEEKPNSIVTVVDNRTAAPENKSPEQKSLDWYTTSAPAEWALLLVGIAGVAAALRSLKAINSQISEMRKQVEVAALQLRAMQEQITEMSEQSSILKESVEVSRLSASAAKTSADIAAGVSVPTLVIQEFIAANGTGAALPAMLQFPKINLVIKNYGKTPALLHSWSLVFTCENLPDVPVYFGYPASGIVLAKEVVKPDEPYTLTVGHSWNRQQFSLEDVQAIIDRRKTLIAYGYVCYGDIFGNPLRRFKFCEVALNLSDGLIDWQSEIGPPSYAGTDQYPMRTAARRKGVEDQTTSANGKTEDHPE